MASPQKTLATVLGAVLTVVGVAGLFVGEGTLLFFNVNMLHNLVHIVSGLLGLLAGLTADGAYAKWYNVGFGSVYLLVALLGLLGVGAVVSLLNLNAADNWLHLLIAVVTLGVGFGASE